MKSYKKMNIGKFLVVALVLGGGLIFGIKMVQKNQENRSKAAVIIPPTKTYCNDGVVSFSVNIPCEKNSFRYMTYKCQDGYVAKEGTATSCKPVGSWIQYAKDNCFSHSKCIEKNVPTITPVISKTVIPTPTASDGYIKQDTQCLNVGGKCQKVINTCNGAYLTGLCPSSGPDIKCCKANTPVVSVTPVATNKICTPGIKECSGSKVQLCNSIGTAWTELANCSYGCNETNKTCNSSAASTLPNLGQKCGVAGICIRTRTILNAGSVCSFDGGIDNGKIKTGLCNGDAYNRCCDAN